MVTDIRRSSISVTIKDVLRATGAIGLLLVFGATFVAHEDDDDHIEKRHGHKVLFITSTEFKRRNKGV